MSLYTPAKSAPFVVDTLDDGGVVLLLGKGKWSTPVSWECVEGVVTFLRNRDWVRIGSKYAVEGEPDTLDGYLKQYVTRATAGWVAAVLAKAGVVEIDTSRPARVRLLMGNSHDRQAVSTASQRGPRLPMRE